MIKAENITCQENIFASLVVVEIFFYIKIRKIMIIFCIYKRLFFVTRRNEVREVMII